MIPNQIDGLTETQLHGIDAYLQSEHFEAFHVITDIINTFEPDSPEQPSREDLELYMEFTAAARALDPDVLSDNSSGIHVPPDKFPPDGFMTINHRGPGTGDLKCLLSYPARTLRVVFANDEGETELHVLKPLSPLVGEDLIQAVTLYDWQVAYRDGGITAKREALRILQLIYPDNILIRTKINPA